MAPRNQVLCGDATEIIYKLKEDSIDTVITSPPYFNLKDYGHIDQIGTEKSLDGWIKNLLIVIDGIAKVLKPTGSLWLNLGDTYSRSVEKGANPKSLLLAPERIGIELVKRGWTIRNKIIWAKTNPMPSPVKDRLSNGYEVIYFATISRNYFFDLDLIREPHLTKNQPIKKANRKSSSTHYFSAQLEGRNSGLKKMKRDGIIGHPFGKNPGDVWRMSTSNYSGNHFATFPESLVKRPLLSTCPKKVCLACGNPWIRISHIRTKHLPLTNKLVPTCRCKSATIPGIVLDPFIGAGTVAKVASEYHRDWLGIELNPEYVSLTNKRINRGKGEIKQS